MAKCNIQCTKNNPQIFSFFTKKTWCGHPKHPKQTKKISKWSSNDHQMSSIPWFFLRSTTSSQALTASMRVRSATESRVSPRAVSMERVRAGRMWPKKTPDIRYIHMFKGWTFVLGGVFWWYVMNKKTRNAWQMLVWQKKLRIQSELKIKCPIRIQIQSSDVTSENHVFTLVN